MKILLDGKENLVELFAELGPSGLTNAAAESQTENRSTAAWLSRAHQPPNSAQTGGSIINQATGTEQIQLNFVAIEKSRLTYKIKDISKYYSGPANSAGS
jgi:hypothetical protein